MPPAFYASLRPARTALSLSLLAAVMALPAQAAKPAWQPVPPEELAETTPRADAVAAEVLLLRVEVDDRQYPQERKTTTYTRYKIFEPEKADKVTRVTDVYVTGSSDRSELYARLTSPDGRVQEFGKDDVRERPLLQQAKQGGFLGWLASGGPEVKERFLAIAGVERGAVLEYRTIKYDRSPPAASLTVGQRDDYPVRRFEYQLQYGGNDLFFNRTFVSNHRGAKPTNDPKAKIFAVTLTDLPAVTLEPYSGPVTDHVATVFNCYEQSQMFLMPRSERVPVPGTIEAKEGPWAAYATLTDWAARDRGWPTKRSAQLAAEIVKPATDDEGKAKLIHQWITKEWQEYRRSTFTKPRLRGARNLDEVINWKKETEVQLNAFEFLWLAFSLYRSAGLTANMVLLPNREFARFNPTVVSQVFLPFQAIAVRIGEEWRFSSPHNNYELPFHMLPWQQEGQQALLAQPKKQEFIPVAVSPAQRTLAGVSGTLTLDAEGAVSGDFARRFTGQTAAPLRGWLRDMPEAKRLEAAKKQLGFELKGAEITVTRIDGLDDPNVPLDLHCSLKWPDFAVRTSDRMIVRPLVFRSDTVTPFPAEERKDHVHFTRRWQELDHVTLIFPAEYEVESPTVPVAVPSEVLHYRVELGIDEAKHAVIVRREFMSNVALVSVERYQALKRFYDHVARSDQHELVLKKKGAATP